MINPGNGSRIVLNLCEFSKVDIALLNLPLSLLHFLYALSSDSFLGKGCSLKYIDGELINRRNNFTASVLLSFPVIDFAISTALG